MKQFTHTNTLSTLPDHSTAYGLNEGTSHILTFPLFVFRAILALVSLVGNSLLAIGAGDFFDENKTAFV